MSVENDYARIKHVEFKEQPVPYIRKKRFLRNRKDANKPKPPVTQGCFNCCNHLSKYYYWKPSPCDTCIRCPTYTYRVSKSGLNDHWKPVTNITYSRRNQLY